MLQPRLFRFRGCLNAPLPRQQISQRAFATHISSPRPVDKDLLEYFDNPSPAPTTQNKGFLLNKQIKSHESFQGIVLCTIARANYILRRILTAQTDEERLRIVKDTDRLGDLLCRIIDLAELIRHTHPDAKWRQAAHNSYDQLLEYMNQLNTHPELSKTVDKLIESKLFQRMTPEAQKTVLAFQLDFHKSGSNLPEATRNRFVELSSRIVDHGRNFMQESTTEPTFQLKPEDLNSLPSTARSWKVFALSKGLRTSIPMSAHTPTAYYLLKNSTSNDLRRRIYQAMYTTDEQQVGHLEQLLRTRAQLAQLVGSDTYAHMTLPQNMAKNPDNVSFFLESLCDNSKQRATASIKEISMMKQEREGVSLVGPWDKELYFPHSPPRPILSLPVLTPGVALFAFSRLIQRLYGVSLRPASIHSGEVWDREVRKVEVVDEDNNDVIGWIYFDLFSRENKGDGAVHYTVRCSRRVDDDDPEGDFWSGENRELTSEIEDNHVLSCEAHKYAGRSGLHQRPVAVVSCGFGSSTSRNKSSIRIGWNDVLTLWHELGHAMHSMLGRTNYGNVAGTRCATDFVEFPSILMEHFLTSPDVLALFHDEPLSSATIEQQQTSQVANPAGAIEAHIHIVLAILDQHFHSLSAGNSESFSSTKELENVIKKYHVLPYAPGTALQTSFHHLFGYGATYYSYLFDRAIASKVWNSIFKADGVNRETGERLGRALRYGGGKDAWSIVSELLEQPELAGGGADAMKEVGKWGVADEVATDGPVA